MTKMEMRDNKTIFFFAVITSLFIVIQTKAWIIHEMIVLIIHFLSF